MHVVLKNQELYVVRDVTLQEFNAFAATSYPDNFFEETFLSKKPEKVSLDFEDIYKSELLKK